jgi:hypothetical protein
MKRLTKRRLKWLRRRQVYESKRLARKKRSGAVVSVISPAEAWKGRALAKVLDMPAVMSFDENSEETVSVLGDFARRMRLQVRGVRLHHKVSKHRGGRISAVPPFRSFETVRVITPAAALVLAAEFERVWRLGGVKPFVANLEKWEPSVVEALMEIGFFETVGFSGAVPNPPTDRGIVIERMLSGETTEPDTLTELMEKLRKLYPDAGVGSDELVHLYGAMMEAIVNVVSHVYPRGVSPWGKPVRRWWMTGAVHRRERWTTAVVYDQGVTIPVTLPKWKKYSGWRTKIATYIGSASDVSDPRYDGRAIEVAVEHALSSTGKGHHGRGLAQMRGFVDQCREGHLRILSRCGEVIFRPGRSPDVTNHASPIRGTLIEWRFLL